MLKITQDQMDAFKKVQLQHFSKRVLVHLEKEGLADSLPDDKLDYVDEQLLFLRDKTGLDSEQHLLDMLIIRLSEDQGFFDRKDVQHILENTALSKHRKCQQLKGLANE